MTFEFTNFQDFMSIHSTHSHFYIDSETQEIKCLRDDLQLLPSIKNDLLILKELSISMLEGNPFQITPEPGLKSTQMLVVNNVAYEIKVAKNDKTTMTHYIVMPFDLRIKENHNKFNRKKDSLTKRETEVLILFSQGLSMTKIARILSISPHTVDSHRIKLCKKLNVRRTTQLAVWAYKLGLPQEIDYEVILP